LLNIIWLENLLTDKQKKFLLKVRNDLSHWNDRNEVYKNIKFEHIEILQKILELLILKLILNIENYKKLEIIFKRELINLAKNL
jgi:hypothetical protein